MPIYQARENPVITKTPLPIFNATGPQRRFWSLVALLGSILKRTQDLWGGGSALQPK